MPDTGGNLTHVEENKFHTARNLHSKQIIFNNSNL
ncbi:hypothetical protein T03_9970 [Trichinella britovi]|uniref:Uncharacterized protein n=1 Tax=Trichinella britovi TaxID=45882 RepID=A0A0V0YWE6_TRIBR|nr:hypothetical protein T03_9970 [Trichinella britovi]